MKVMWITMAAIGRASMLFGGQSVQSGGWIDATLDKIKPFIDDGSLELDIVAIGNCDRSICEENSSVRYHMIQINRYRGKTGPASDTAKWKALIEKLSPDIIQIWGSEFTFGLDVLKVAGSVPVCIYIQGITKVLAQHPAGDIPLFKLYRMSGLLSIFKFRSMMKEMKSNICHQKFESELFRLADGIIVDNDWSKAQIFTETDKFYDVSLAMNDVFYDNKWDLSGVERHSLFTVAGGASPIKGIHNAVYAVAKLKEKYPDIKLYIPGHITSRKPHFLYDTVFIRHIKKIIAKFGLEPNVIFTGKLTPEEMADRMRRSNAFVMPSCVETHSSTLREAMTVGCPSVSAVVGSVLEFAEHGKSAFLYRYDDVDALAYYIDKIFSDDTLAEKLSMGAVASMKEKYPKEKIGEDLYHAYESMMRGGKI